MSTVTTIITELTTHFFAGMTFIRNQQQQLASSNREYIIKSTTTTKSKESGIFPFDLILKIQFHQPDSSVIYTTTILSLIDSISDTISKDILENFSTKLESISTTTYTHISLSGISQEESEGLYPVCTVIISMNSGFLTTWIIRAIIYCSCFQNSFRFIPIFQETFSALVQKLYLHNWGHGWGGGGCPLRQARPSLPVLVSRFLLDLSQYFKKTSAAWYKYLTCIIEQKF